MKKTHDLVVVTGTYKKDGIDKKRYKNIGVMMEDDKGGRFIMIERSFNPAGIPYKEGSESIMVSLYEPKNELTQHSKDKANGYQKDEDIPF